MCGVYPRLISYFCNDSYSEVKLESFRQWFCLLIPVIQRIFTIDVGRLRHISCIYKLLLQLLCKINLAPLAANWQFNLSSLKQKLLETITGFSQNLQQFCSFTTTLQKSFIYSTFWWGPGSPRPLSLLSEIMKPPTIT